MVNLITSHVLILQVIATTIAYQTVYHDYYCPSIMQMTYVNTVPPVYSYTSGATSVKLSNVAKMGGVHGNQQSEWHIPSHYYRQIFLHNTCNQLFQIYHLYIHSIYTYIRYMSNIVSCYTTITSYTSSKYIMTILYAYSKVYALFRNDKVNEISKEVTWCNRLYLQTDPHVWAN